MNLDLDYDQYDEVKYENKYSDENKKDAKCWVYMVAPDE